MHKGEPSQTLGNDLDQSGEHLPPHPKVHSGLPYLTIEVLLTIMGQEETRQV